MLFFYSNLLLFIYPLGFAHMSRGLHLHVHRYPGYEAYPDFDHIQDMLFTWKMVTWFFTHPCVHDSVT